jgi:uncharacterized membrane protein YhiD involved in acid resistance
MKLRKLFLFLLFVSLILTNGSQTNPVSAQENGFSETFDDPLLPGWEHSPEVIVTNGVLRIGPGNFVAGGGVWQDFTTSIRFRFSGMGETSINYRASDSGSYILLITPEAVLLMRTLANSQPIELAHAATTHTPSDTWMDLNINLVGGEHSVSVNEIDLLSASDPEPLPPGGLVITSNGERTTELDSVSMEQLIGEAESVVGVPAPAPATVVTIPTPTSIAPVSWQAWINEQFTNQGNVLDLTTIFVNFVLAVITSFILSRVYIYWGASLSNRRKFAANFMLITVTTMFIISVVRSSVALSLGLVGALSIIRFRAAIKDPEELAYLFFAISLGIGLGDNQRMVTLLTMLIVIVLIGISHFLRQSQADTNLHMEITSHNPNKVEMPQVMEVLAKHCSKLRLLRYDENEETLEMSFVVEFKHTSDLNQARSALLELSPALKISFLDNKGVW